MNAKERREKIREILNKSEGKVKGNDLADLFQVSRQIVVGDVALLKASGLPVISTPRGYYVEKGKSSHAERTLVCIHQKRQTAKVIKRMITRELLRDTTFFKASLRSKISRLIFFGLFYRHPKLF